MIRSSILAAGRLSMAAPRVESRRRERVHACVAARIAAVVGIAILNPHIAPAHAQVGGPDSPIDTLVHRAVESSPSVLAAVRRVEAARARVGPAGALPDPMLMAGIMNLPVSDPGFDDFMTMKSIGVGQRLPYPGKLSLARRAAELEVSAAEARVNAVRASVAADIRMAWYDLALLDRSIEVLERNQALLVELIRVTESRYGVGTGGQPDLLKARVEASRLAEAAVTLTETRRSRLAQLNALLDRPVDTPVDPPTVPDRIVVAATSGVEPRARFVSDRLGARLSDSSMPPLSELQARSVASNPDVRAHLAALAAQEARVELARKAHLPDFDVSIQYGQRTDRTDMASLMVTLPIPIRRGARQTQQLAEAEAELAAMHAEHRAMLNRIAAEVAAAHAEAERSRSSLALFVRSIIPLGRGALESAIAAYHLDGADFLDVIENQTTLYDYDIAYHRTLTAFAKSIAELERVVGGEVLQ
jgi:outer membrane protein TolC